MSDAHGHGHGHGHSHGPTAADALTSGARYRRPLLIALLLTTSFVAVEFAAGLISGSLALLSDAGHMLSDAGGLGMSLAATTLATGGTAAASWYWVDSVIAIRIEGCKEVLW